MSQIENLLSRLEIVRSVGPGKWAANCPAHDDRHPSLAIRELDDGRILLHCFSGCEVADIVAAIELNLSDLFPERTLDSGYRAEKRPYGAELVLKCIRDEALIVLVAASKLQRAESLSDYDFARLDCAYERLYAACNLAGIRP